MSQDPVTEHPWPQACLEAHLVGQGGASTRSGARPRCARFLYGLAFGLWRSLACLSPGGIDGDGPWGGAGAAGVGCLSPYPTVDAHGQARQVLGVDRDW